MSHDATKIYMGSTQSNVKEVDNYSAVAATYKAGLCVHLASSGALTLVASSGSKLGISLGRSLSDTDRVAVCRKGLRVPVLVASGATPVIGAQVQIHATSGMAVDSGTAVNAVYASEAMDAYDEDGTLIGAGVKAAYIDFQGGL